MKAKVAEGGRRLRLRLRLGLKFRLRLGSKIEWKRRIWDKEQGRLIGRKIRVFRALNSCLTLHLQPPRKERIILSDGENRFRVVAQPGSASRLGAGGSAGSLMKYYVYIIFSESLNRYYCGSTDNFVKRLKEHNSGKGKYTSKGVPWKEVKLIDLASRSEAMKLESQVKKRGIKRYLDDLGSKTSGGGAAR